MQHIVFLFDNEKPCHTQHHAKNKFKKTLRKLEDAHINTPTLIEHGHV